MLPKDLTGQRFGRLLVIGLAPRTTRKKYWACVCDCGNKKLVRVDSLTSGNVTSCGCLKAEQDRINLVKAHKHKQSGTRLYKIWLGMKARCNNKNIKCYYRYGGKGISVCNAWLNNFELFMDWALNSGYAENLTIDRIDNSGNYEPGNCRWVDNKAQCNNRKTTTKITLNGETKSRMEWCEEIGLNYGTVKSRQYRGRDLVEQFSKIKLKKR